MRTALSRTVPLLAVQYLASQFSSVPVPRAQELRAHVRRSAPASDVPCIRRAQDRVVHVPWALDPACRPQERQRVREAARAVQPVGRASATFLVA